MANRKSRTVVLTLVVNENSVPILEHDGFPRAREADCRGAWL